MIKGFKGFNADLKCRDFQFQVGGEYEESSAKICEKGFHFCENPMDVLGYYPPSDSRYAEVEGDGKTDKDGDNSKVACSKLKVGVEIGISGLISAGVKFVLERVNWADNKATNTGYQSASTNTGHRSASSVEGEESVAVAIGYESKAKGAIGCWIVVAEWREDESGKDHIIDVQCANVDGENIKQDTFYQLKDGKFVTAKED